MPTYKTTRDRIAATVAAIEKKGELIVQVVELDDGLAIISRLPEDTTGQPRIPSWAKEDR